VTARKKEETAAEYIAQSAGKLSGLNYAELEVSLHES